MENPSHWLHKWEVRKAD